MVHTEWAENRQPRGGVARRGNDFFSNFSGPMVLREMGSRKLGSPKTDISPEIALPRSGEGLNFLSREATAGKGLLRGKGQSKRDLTGKSATTRSGNLAGKIFICSRLGC
ncbi:hypothetical protein Adt_32454 [Abeliophyllum distichum]|uniref:Uncharacterized protein n=1 Tax=Abeliophyllum distichum TaxID=126358 RepID=A0ABD1QTJ3_9LAMI